MKTVFIVMGCFTALFVILGIVNQDQAGYDGEGVVGFILLGNLGIGVFGTIIYFLKKISDK